MSAPAALAASHAAPYERYLDAAWIFAVPRDALDGAKAALGGTSSAAARRAHRIDGIALGMHESCQESNAAAKTCKKQS